MAGTRHRHDGPTATEEHQPVDVNAAPADALAAVPGISVRLADRIVAARPFERLEDLRRVPGVSENLLSRLRQHGVKVTRPPTDGKGIVVTLQARLRGGPPRGADVAAYLFDDDGNPLGEVALKRGQGELPLPARVHGRMITVAVAPLDGAHAVSLERLRARGVPTKRLPVDDLRKLDLGVLELDPRLFKRSCCRVRGRVVRRVTLPSGRVVVRPVCNARVVVYEVDESPRRLIARLPDDLVVRLRDELAEFVPPGPGPDPARLVLPSLAEVDVAMLGRAARPTAVLVRDRTPITARRWLEANLDLLAVNWCRLSWLHRDYHLDEVATAEVDDQGRFDVDFTYPCYGDRPDLYFKVEQRCDDDEWTVTHAPSVACTTRWNFCCGEDVQIEVTSPAAALGPALEPVMHITGTDDPAEIGVWETLPYASQVFAVHAAVLRTGQVLLFSGGAERQLPRESRVWDPSTGGFSAQPFDDDLFCAFQTALPDGRVLVMGGSNYQGPHGVGIKATYTFDPVGGWAKQRDMRFGRWYPTAVSLPDGRVLVMSGRDANGGVVAQVECFDPATNGWVTLPDSASKTLDIYPSLHLMADGRIFYTGTRWEGGSSSPRPWAPPDTALFDPATNSWSDVGPHVIRNRTEATSVLLPPRVSAAHFHGHGEEMPPPGTLTRVLVLGGDCAAETERNSAEIIDLSEHDPTWRRLPDMRHRRVNPNAVVLPDGDVLVCAGIQRFKWDPDPGGVLEAELFDSQAETWRRAAVMTVARQYHSVSVLLPDGRVLNTGSVGGSGGGTNLTSMEVYSPSYLFRGPRPQLDPPPTAVSRGGELIVSSRDACRVRRAVLVRPGAPTHHTDSDQRLIPLEFDRRARCGLALHVPAEPAVLPPGYYLLFVLDDAGIPSIGRFVNVS